MSYIILLTVNVLFAFNFFYLNYQLLQFVLSFSVVQISK